jgi:hypothetical protein
MNNSINKLIEKKTNNPFLFLEEHFFATVLLLNKTYMKFNSKTCRMKFSSSSQNRKVSAIRFVYNKIHHIMFILIFLYYKNIYLKLH